MADIVNWIPFVDRALKLAQIASDNGEVPVGAVLVRDGKVICEAHNNIVSRHDPTAHAEMLVIKEGSKYLNNERLTGCTLVVTLEPCSMCAGAAVLARIERLVYGASDPKSGAAGSVFNLTGSERLNHRIEVVSGVKAEESAELLRQFFKERRRGAGAVERARLEIE